MDAITKNPVPAQNPSTVSNPATVEANPAEAASRESSRKQTEAFIRMRQEKAELKRRLESLEANKGNTATPAVEPPAQGEPPVAAKPTVDPNQIRAQVISEIEERNRVATAEREAIANITADSTLSQLPGAAIEVIDMCDNDPKLKRLYDVDPAMALNQAKALYLSRMGVANPNIPPTTTTPNTGMGGARHDDLKALYAAIKQERPGTRAFNDLVDRINRASRG